MKYFKLLGFCLILVGLSLAGILSCNGQQGDGGGGGGTCTDLAKNGDETDVDCGGSCPNKCAVGKACSTNNDCVSGKCTANVCQALNLSFDNPKTSATGMTPVVVATGDFNTDGKLDVATANSASNDISVLIGKGDGTFNPPASQALGSSALSVVSGEFTGDANTDLAATNNATIVALFKGKGDGTFDPHVDTTVGNGGTSPKGFASGDFNGDGKADDLVVVNTTDSNLSVLINNGSGTFTVQAANNAGGLIQSPRGLATGNFNTDTRSDIAVVNINNQNATALLNDTGSFPAGQAKNYATDVGTPGPRGVATGDFNGDKRDDLAVANAQGKNVGILLNDGTGNFGTATPNAANNDTESVAAADFNRDGFLDVAAANVFGDDFVHGNISVFLGKGNGTFDPQVKFNINANPNRARHVATGDVNGDGKSDLIIVDDQNNDVVVLLNTSS